MIKSKKTVLILTLVVSLLLPTTAYAYNILSYGYVTAHRNVNVISIRSNSTYRSAYDSSVNDWQNAIRGVKFTQSISSNYINRVTVADTWYGIYRGIIETYMAVPTVLLLILMQTEYLTTLILLKA